MRASLLLFALPLCACQAIVGSYEVGPQDTGARDTATTTDTAVSDTGTLIVTSCKDWKAKEPGLSNGPKYIIPVGSRGYPNGVQAFCEAAGFTLVAIRSSTTLGTAWAAADPMGNPTPPASVKRSVDLQPDDADAFLDIDWKLLGFTEVVYDLGAPDMGPAKTRISFRDLTTEHVDTALTALTHGHPPDKRPDCFIDTNPTAVTHCVGSSPPPDGMKALGWAYAPTNQQCYWGYTDQPGSKGCDGSTVGKGRVLVR